MTPINKAYIINQISSISDKVASGEDINEKHVARWLARLAYVTDHEACMMTVNTLETSSCKDCIKKA